MSWREAEPGAAWTFVRELAQEPGAFLQCPAWARYQRELGAATKTLGWFEGERLAGLAVLVRRDLPLRWCYWVCAKGPLMGSWLSVPVITRALAELADSLRSPRTLCLRLEPAGEPRGGARRTLDESPRATSVVDLAVTEHELLGRMHEKTRYNIRLAERHGLNFRWAGAREFESFWRLLRATARRERFRTHTASHYRTLLELFGDAPLATPELACRLGLVEYQGELLAGNMVVVCARHATYLHGASSRAHRELMAPHLLHGAAMRALQVEGCLSYDLWGVQPADNSLAAWEGFSRFKLGFGGVRREAPGTFDYLLSPAYHLYRLARHARRALWGI